MPKDLSRAMALGVLLAPVMPGLLLADSQSTLTGRVIDPSGRAVPGAEVLIRNSATLLERFVFTSNEGEFGISGLPAGVYQLQVTATGFRPYEVQELRVDVGRTSNLEIYLTIGDTSEAVTVKSQIREIDGSTISVGHEIEHRSVQELPLNGRYLLDLAVLSPGSVTASQNGFNTVSFRGLGSLGINTAGNREDAVNFLMNGVTLNDQLFSGIMFQPSISAVEEFRIDNSTISAEFGHSSGAVVLVATRSGTNRFHADFFEFLRNDVLDARNFFTLTSSSPPPFKRNQFGGALQGPMTRKRTFLFSSYEGLRLAQHVDLNSVVLTEAQRQAASSAAVAKLATLIPRPNFIDSSGTPRFITSTSAPVHGDQAGLDIVQLLENSDQLHGYYTIYRTNTVEPGGRGTTIPGFGNVQYALRQFFSLNYTKTFGSQANEARAGLNRQSSHTLPAAQLNPLDYGIRDGINRPTGLPQISVGGGALNFGGPAPYPSGRGDTTFVAGDTLSCACGRLFLKLGGDFRQFLNNNFRLGSGAFNFVSISDFLADNANSFSVTLGNQSSAIAQGALGFFVQSDYRWRPNFMLDVGIRYDWNMTPTERYGRFIAFDPQTAEMVGRGQAGNNIYRQNNTNFQPRIGFAWDPFKDGKTSIRAAYAILVDEPITNVVVGTSGNPPLANPLTYTGTVSFENAIDVATAAGLAPLTVDRRFTNPSLQSWNLNIQRELRDGLAVMAGYFGSKGTHLTLVRNINQPVGGVRPYPAISLSSAILPGTALGNIAQTESTGNSSYNAFWLSANQRLARGWQVHLSYSWAKSIDYNSLSSQGVVVQNSYDLRNDRGLSDFDARHRFVINVVYEFSAGNRFVKGWEMAAIVQLQSGNPVNILTPSSAITGTANTLRPDTSGPLAVYGSPDGWFDTSVFAAVPHFGNIGRNVIIGPGFNNTDLSIMRNIAVRDRVHLQLRVEVFDLLNHANFGQPGNIVGSPNFGRITNTRFPTGESGSSRQIQFGMKLAF
jgi:hypothetical protein